MTEGRGALDVPNELVDWIEDVCSGRIERVQRVSGGNRRRSWAIDVGAASVFLRYDPGDPDASCDPYTIWREADVYRVVAQTPVRAPGLLAVHPTIPAVLTQCVPGSSDFHRVVDAAEQVAVAVDLMHQLAALHGQPLDAIDLGRLGPARSIAEHIDAELDAWEAMYRETDWLDPLIEHALRWLRTNRPTVARPPALVHGDFGPGNFLFENGRVTALIDWEFCHVGDPMEDLAWLSMRTVLQAFPDFTARLRDYEEASGQSVDVGRVRYHRVLVQTRVAIIRHRDMGNPDPGGDVGNGLVSRATNRRLLVEELAALDGVDLGALLDAVAPEVSGTDAEHTWLYDALIGLIRRTADDTEDRKAVTSLKTLARVIKFLREADRLEVDLERHERRELQAVLDEGIGEVPVARQLLGARIRAGTVTAPYRYFAFDIARDRLLMGPSLGALVNRHLPALEIEHEEERT